MVCVGCVFDAGIHLSRTWMSGPFKPVLWNACVHRLDLGWYCHLRERVANGVRTNLNWKGKMTSTGSFWGGSNLRCVTQDSKPITLPTELFPPQSCEVNFFFFFPFPSYISEVHHFWVRFLRMWPFFNPTTKVVTFRLRGWCVLGVFLLRAFTRLGHERQDLLSPCNEMHVFTD